VVEHNLEMRRPVDSSDYSDTVSRYTVPSRVHKDGREVPVQPVHEIYALPWGSGTPRNVRTIVTNDNDHTIVFAKRVILRGVGVQYECSADVGARVVVIAVTDGTNILFTSEGLGLTASQVGHLCYGLFATARTATARKNWSAIATSVNAAAYDGMSPLVLNAGSAVRFVDTANIAAAADDMITVLLYEEYDE